MRDLIRYELSKPPTKLGPVCTARCDARQHGVLYEVFHERASIIISAQLGLEDAAIHAKW